MPKINQEEYEILKNLDDKWKWIARDRDTGKLPYSDMVHVYEEKPFKTGNVWTVGYGTEKLGKNLFQFIQWEDENPYNIAELIEEYEENLANEIINRQFESLFGESEETDSEKDFVGVRISDHIDMDNLDFTEEILGLNKMFAESGETEVKKDIEWLKNSIAKVMLDLYHTPKPNYFDFEEANKQMRELVNQLDEPEITELDALNRLAENVQFSADEIASHLEKLSAYNGEVTYGEQGTLSQKWIDGKKIGVRNRIPFHMDVDYAVPEEDLQNILVPKQEEITEEQAWEVLSELYDIPNKSYIREAMRVVADSVEDESTIGELKEQLAKPTIPQFVADWFEEYKEDELIITAGTVIGNRRFPKDTKVARWLNEDYVRNSEIFAKAWLAYPNIEVEEEQKFSVRDKEGVALLGKITELYGRKDYKIGDVVSLQNVDTQDGVSEWNLVLTEEEIKGYDPRYMTFAKPVEELEE